MTEITLKYGGNSILWSEIAELCAVTNNELRCINLDNETIVLRVFETAAEAELARERLIEQVGGGTTVIIIDDL
jgi:hypothetical protein